MVHDNTESSFVELNKSLLRKFNEALFQGGIGYLGTDVNCVYIMWMALGGEFE